MSKTVGMYGGKFYPIHMGHVYAMTMASTMVDELHVIVSYDSNYEQNVLSKDSKLPHVDFKQRLRWWKEITKDMPHVHVHAVYEENTGKIESWKQGAEGIKKAVGEPITHVFSSEHAYTEFFNVLYPDAEHVVVDANREKYTVSATKLRTEGVYANWELLPEVVRRYYVKKVVIVGTESCGKSTLVKNLATLYNTNYVEEYGRTFYEELGGCEDITMAEDYQHIAYQHKVDEYNALKNANKVLFVDTEAIVTQYYLKAYLNKRDALLTRIANNQNYDLWIFLEPDVKWVDDGTRTFGEQSVREQNNEELKYMLKYLGVEYITINGNYEERAKKAIKLIDNLLT
ncbi:nicotinamide-nucleotide adenylyltransferase/ribosylnicotinamide kinase [Bacillus phage Kirov]|uniref:Nicotinamide-nucleotide adenylyltransferase/ribosylnicotinamide kinase n=1 Tax=Bacillus phage Kirov TaxID=2783539 RepID=A0A7U3NKN0_9CAUD|nr:nicotinamide-nucleotide adenylyltransferase [Bacillus phage Kirov]QOV08400.1 nicotinamide-nucleotide adenylyltransferase/ribosylnicotinamide kinase [Bacillus phage Kirov]